MTAGLKVSLLAIALAACSNNAVQPISSSGEADAVILTNDQMAVVEAGLREMIGGPLPAAPRSIRAVSFSGKPGIHVCGNIDHNGKETPFYIEVRDKNAKSYAERGQLATDDGKRAKIAFVCRHHG